MNKINSFFKENHDYISSLNNNNNSVLIIKKSFIFKLSIVFRNLIDLLKFLLKFKHSKIIFTTPNIISYENFFNERCLKNTSVLNYHTTKITNTFSGQKVYNIGFWSKIFNNKFLKRNRSSSTYKFYKLLLNFINYDEIFIPCYYDEVTFNLISICNNKKITEIQHGSIINFFPYSRPSPIKLVDEIFVNNIQTKNYLEEHLYKDFKAKVILKKDINLDSVKYCNLKEDMILYCSSVEVNGIHPVLYKYLQKSNLFKLRIRMHPRETSKKIFSDQLDSINIKYDFDKFNDWKDNLNNYNLIVVTPWSSIAEESTDLSIKTIIIDKIGRDRFKHLIDDNVCMYTNDLKKILNEK